MTTADADITAPEADIPLAEPAVGLVASVGRWRPMRWAIAVTVLLAIGGAVSAFIREATGHDLGYGLVPLFDLDGEGSLAQVFSALLLLASAGLSLAGAQVARRDGDGQSRHWRVLALAFCVLAVEGLVSLHALFDRPFIELTGLGGRWPVLIRGVAEALLAAAVLAAYVPFLRRLPRETALRFVVAGGIYIGAAVGLDAVTAWIVDAVGGGTATYAVISGCEELLEMVGLLVFIDACLAYLARGGATLDLRISFRRR